MATDEQIRARLEAAEAALDKLMLGGQLVEIEYEGHRQKFKPTDEEKLRRYIRSLKKDLGEVVSPSSRAAIF